MVPKSGSVGGRMVGFVRVVVSQKGSWNVVRSFWRWGVFG